MNATENGMVVGLGDALERHYAAADATAREFAELKVLGDVSEFAYELEDVCCMYDDLSNEADRALRVPGRLEEAGSAVVIAALLLAAHRNDAEDTLRAARLLVSRYLAGQAQRVDLIAGGVL